MKHYPVKYVSLSNGEQIAYRQAGDSGSALVLIHGNISSSVHWQTTMEQLENEYCIYAPDLRGFGDSSYKKEFSSIRELAEDVKEFIDALGISDFSVVGWSAGGPVAIEVAADWPERVNKVVFLCSGALTGFPYSRKGKPPISPEHPVTKEELLKNPRFSFLRKSIEKKRRRVLRFLCNLTLYKLNKPSKEDYEHYLDAMVKQRCKNDIDYSLVVYNMTHDSNGVVEGSGRVDLVKSPVVILSAEHDKIVPLAWSQEAKELLGECAELVIMPGVGHSPVTDNLQQTVDCLRNALK